MLASNQAHETTQKFNQIVKLSSILKHARELWGIEHIYTHDDMLIKYKHNAWGSLEIHWFEVIPDI